MPTSATRDRCWPTSPPPRGPRRRSRPRSSRRPWRPARTRSPPAARRWRSGSRPAAGCTRSATEAARPTARRLRRCSRARRLARRRRTARSAPTGADRALPALNLAADQAVVTALGNDVGFDLVFSRQIIAHAAARDIAVAFSTSGNSRDLMAALSEAHGRGLLTVGFAGYDGGQMAASGDVDYCFVVRSQSIHRIQESQALLGYHLWASTQQVIRKAAEKKKKKKKKKGRPRRRHPRARPLCHTALRRHAKPSAKSGSSTRSRPGANAARGRATRW